MASIIKKIKKGRPYYYAVESARVNGKPRIVWQKYLGTLDDIVKRVDNATAPEVKELDIFNAGGVAAMLRIAERLRLLEIINDVVTKRSQGPTIGHYILIAAINRILDPCSKEQMPEWYRNTVLQRLWKFSSDAFNSQRFWDHMDLISESDIELIQDKIALRVQEEFGIDPKIILYDTTNFFTYIATNNKRNTIAQRGRSKAKRNDLRQVGLALIVTKDYQIPLFHRVYQGNINDVSLFPEVIDELKKKHIKTLGSSKEATIVFDKGNISAQAMETIVVSGQHFVCALPKSHATELFETPIEKFLPVQDLVGTRIFSTDIEMWGKNCVAVLTYSESFFTRQLMNLTADLQKKEQKLHDLQNSLTKLSKKRSSRPTLAEVKKRVKEILSGEYAEELIIVRIEEKEGIPRVHYQIDQGALDRLSKHVLGRTLLVSSRTEWTAEEIISAYRGQNTIECAFKAMKGRDYLHWQPAYHWTDQKVKVHGFYCVLALLLATTAHKLVKESRIDISLPQMLEELSGIREVALMYSDPGLGTRNSKISLSRFSPTQKKLAEALEIGTVLAG